MSTAESDLLARYNRLIEENIHREYEQLCRNGSRQKRNPVQSKNRAQNSPNRANVVANCRPYDHSIRMISGNTQQTLTPIAANIRQNTILTLPSAVRNRLSTADGPGNTVNTSGHHEQQVTNTEGDVHSKIDNYNRMVSVTRGHIARPGQKSSSEQGQVNRNRKIRTTITREKLTKMNSIFISYQRIKDSGQQPDITLKQIGVELDLGYSTILHKYRQFRATRKVKGGALINLTEQKRKYQKSLCIQRVIRRALKQRSFYTAGELVAYINNTFKLSLTRSIVSRHLGDMGYSYRNVRKDKGRNDPKVKEVRKLYADCVMPVLRRDEVVMFVGETLFALENSVQEEQDKAEEKTMSHRVEECMSVIAIIHENGLMYSALKEGIIGRLDFEEALRDCFGPLSCLNEEVIGSCTAHLFLNMAPLHCHEESLEGNRKYLMQRGIDMFFLPPFSGNLNAVEQWFKHLHKEVRRLRSGSLTELRRNVQELLLKYHTVSMQTYFNDCKQWLQKALDRENFY